MTISMAPRVPDADLIAGLQTEARNERTADIDVASTVEMMGELRRALSTTRTFTSPSSVFT